MPPKTGSKVRLFNLAADVPSAGLSDASGKALVSGVKYTLGSVWAPIPAAAGTFAATSATGGTVASAPMTPPNAPQVFTAFLLGVKGFGYTLMPQIDAPVSGGAAGPAALRLLSGPRVRAGVWAVPARRRRAAGGVLGQFVGRGGDLIQAHMYCGLRRHTRKHHPRGILRRAKGVFGRWLLYGFPVQLLRDGSRPR